MKTISTQEQVARIHANLNTDEQGYIVTPVELATNFATGNKYVVEGNRIEVTAKRSGDGSGKKTIYIAKINGDDFEGSIEDLKKLLNIDYRRPKAGSNNSNTALGKLHYEVVEKVAKLVDACSEEVTESEFTELKAAYNQLWALVGTFRQAQKAAAEESKKIDKIKSLLATLTPEQRKALGL